MNEARVEPVIDTTPATQDGLDHLVCHCTEDGFSACGLDVSKAPWADTEQDASCPLCWLRWPDGSPCPWGCACEECLV